MFNHTLLSICGRGRSGLAGWLLSTCGAALALEGGRAAEYPPVVDEAALRKAIASMKPVHPRLMMRPADIRELRGRLAGDDLRGDVARTVLRDAEAMLKVPTVERTMEGRRLLDQSRRAVRRLLTLAMAHHLTGRPEFAARAAREMLAIASFSDWNPSHFLDVAEMTFAMAIGVDWLHDSLDSETRGIMRRAILEKGVRVPLDTRHHGWTRARNNWGQVCHAGMVAGALATAEDDPDAAVRTIARALEHVPASMAMYEPNGSYPEGPGYWSYGTTYNVLLIAMLESTLGRCFGLDHAPGFDRTGQYPALMTGPSGYYFNYADGGSSRGCEPAVHWFADRYNRPDWLAGDLPPLHRTLRARSDGKSSSNRAFPLLLLWMTEASGHGVASRMPLNWSSECKTPVTVHRSSWDDPSAVFVGLKAGSPSGPHGHMDAGSFVLDADGVRWAVDLGAEGYHRIESRGMNFWSMAQNSDRWRVFRQSNQSHNTLVIDGAMQNVAGTAKIVGFSDGAKFPHSVVDLGPVYAGQAGSAHRGIALLPTGEVLVRDRLTGLKPGTSVRWGMVTPGRPDAPGDRAIELHKDKSSLAARILAPAQSRWSLEDTAKPKNEWDSPNPGTVMIFFHALAPESGQLDLAVVLTPGSRTPAPPDSIPMAPPMEWKP